MRVAVESEHMRNQRIVIEKPGGRETLKLLCEEVPEPEGRQVRVRILASGVAYADILRRENFIPFTRYPVTPGHDFVGVVDKNGPQALGFKPGDLVAGLPMVGSYSQYICMDENGLLGLPDRIDPVKAVSLVLNYTTAYRLLMRDVKLKTDDPILVHGAAGGVGSAILQISRHFGFKVFGTADTKKLDLIRELGAEPIDYKHVDFVAEMNRRQPDGVNAVFDPIGGSHLFRSNAVLAKGGTLVSYGFASAFQRKKNPTLAIIQTLALFSVLKLMPNSKKFVVSSGEISTKKKSFERFRRDFSEILKLFDRGALSPIIAACFPLKETAKAHELMESAQFTGKIILLPN